MFASNTIRTSQSAVARGSASFQWAGVGPIEASFSSKPDITWNPIPSGSAWQADISSSGRFLAISTASRTNSGFFTVPYTSTTDETMSVITAAVAAEIVRVVVPDWLTNTTNPGFR
jgi:hypothetical protein